jgi:hypothetical protein
MKNSNSRVTFRLWVEMSQGLLKANLSAAGRKEAGRSAVRIKRALSNKQLRMTYSPRSVPTNVVDHRPACGQA